jgi:hypothetical protein
VAAVAALVVLAVSPAVGSASLVVIESAGPLSPIFIDDDLGCQVHSSGDVGLSFYGGIEPSACGTFLAFTEGEDEAFEGGGSHLWGPSPLAGPLAGVKPELPFTPEGEQAISGEGTKAKPYLVTTVARAIEPVEETELEPVARLTETDSYVVGQDFYTTTLKIENLLFEQLEGTLYHAGHCLLAGLGAGFGAENVPSAGSVACTIEPGNVPPARYMAFTPLARSGGVAAPHLVEGEYTHVWEGINREGLQLPDTVDATTDQENAMGLSWPIDLEGNDSSHPEGTLSFMTTISPWSPPTSSSSAGACVADGQVQVSVAAVDGPAAVAYVLDGAPAALAPTNGAGQATIGVGPGQHTLEYWGVDEAGAQESAHHALSVTFGAPSVTITSDQGTSSYKVGEPASVTIAAAGPALTLNPSRSGLAISTAAPGTFSVPATAANACGSTTAAFTYTVAAPVPPPPPVLGKSVNVAPVSGTVLVALPTTASASLAGPPQAAFASASKGLKFVPLTEARQIPVGSTLEATAGVAMITTATSSKGKTQLGEFGAGIFKLLQSRKQKGLTELDVIDNHSPKQVCATLDRKAAVDARHLSGKALGRLNSSAHGKFTTRGQYSAATVRGTVWDVTDQCDGTLTKVVRGKVSVRDFRRRKTITLFTGQSYLAMAP